VALLEWAPTEVETTERIAGRPARELAALLDRAVRPAEGDPLPPLWHWLYFLDSPLQGELGVDGHPASGGFLPPLPQRRRMFAGGRVRFLGALRYGEAATRRSRLVRYERKEGRSGSLHFVTVEHRLCDASGRELVVEEQDLVYRSAPPVTSPGPELGAGTGWPERDSPWQARWRFDPVQLFRFSAITGNAHRIHYDLPYARDVEGFPGLVVHGPLLALLLIELARAGAPGRAVAAFSFRAARPTFAGEAVLVHGGPVGEDGAGVAVEGAEGPPRMTAEIRFQASEATKLVS